MGQPQPLHTLKDYSTEKGVPICLHENRFFRMMFNGYFHYLDAVRYGRGVIMLPQFANGDFLMVRQQRAPAIGLSLEFPRGGVDAEETVEQAARRELLEETGYGVRPEDVTLLGDIGADTATLNGVSQAYYLQIADDYPVAEFDSSEIAEVLRITPTEFATKVRQGEVVDGISLAAYALAAVAGVLIRA